MGLGVWIRSDSGRLEVDVRRRSEKNPMTRCDVDRRNEVSLSFLVVVLVCNDCEPFEEDDASQWTASSVWTTSRRADVFGEWETPEYADDSCLESLVERSI